MLRRTVAAAVVMVVGLFLVGAPAGADTKSQLKAAEAKLNDLIDQISAESQQISDLEGQIALKTSAIEAVKVTIQQTQAKIVKLEGDIEKATLELQATQRQLDRRAWVAYEAGPGSRRSRPSSTRRTSGTPRTSCRRTRPT